jgi:hypothetical protein
MKAGRKTMKVIGILRSLSLAGSVLLTAAVTPASAATVDQVQPYYEGFLALPTAAGDYSAQTFTVGLPGVLDSVEILLAAPLDLTSGSLTFEVRKTIGGLPDLAPGALLFSLTIPESAIPADLPLLILPNAPWDSAMSFDVSAANIPAVPGEVLAIVLSTDVYVQNVVNNLSDFPFDYAGGAKYYYSNQSAAWAEDTHLEITFRTFVEVPEPATALLLLPGLICLTRRH